MDETRGSESIKKVGAPLALAALFCLPCLLPLIAVLVGVAAFSALGGWLAGNALAVALASGVVAVGAVLVTYVVIARRRQTSCEPLTRSGPEQEVLRR